MSAASAQATLPGELREAVENALAAFARDRLDGLPPSLADPIRYSLAGGGKRLRGMLLLAGYRAAGGTGDASALAAAVEIFHAYSLVHDDLPCMDDDDVRRGRLTTHRVYGVAPATLAGAVMIPLAARLAYDAAAALVLPEATGCTIVKVLAEAAGAGGMIGGQLLDLEAEAGRGSWGAGSGLPILREDLDAIHSAKTGALIAASLEIGGMAAGASEEHLRALAGYGSRVGLAFQIMDDVLDVTSSTDALGKITGRDAALGKSTYPARFGIGGAKDRATCLVREACESLRLHGLLTPDLEELAAFVVSRNH